MGAGGGDGGGHAGVNEKEFLSLPFFLFRFAH